MNKNHRNFFFYSLHVARIFIGSALLLLGLTACQNETPIIEGGVEIVDQGEKIFGGEKATAESPIASFLVVLRFENEEGGTEECTGSWLTKTWILTAAHCLPQDPGQLRIYQGLSLSDVDHARQPSMAVKSMVKHPRADSEKKRLTDLKDYSTGNRYDLALIEVERPAKGHQWFIIGYGPLKTEHEDLVPRTYQSAGYGAESYNLRSGARAGESALSSAILKSVAPAKDGVFYVSQKAGTAGICVGDSGSPLMPLERDHDRYVLLGVASSVRNPGEAEVCFGESRFVEIESHIPWIHQTIRGN